MRCDRKSNVSIYHDATQARMLQPNDATRRFAIKIPFYLAQTTTVERRMTSGASTFPVGFSFGTRKRKRKGKRERERPHQQLRNVTPENDGVGTKNNPVALGIRTLPALSIPASANGSASEIVGRTAHKQ